MAPEQAKAVTEAIGNAVGSADTVTRADLDALRADLRSDIAEVRADMASQETRMMRALYTVAAALLAAQVAAVFALLRLLGGG